MALCLPKSIATKTSLEETQFFVETTPLSRVACFEAAYTALFGIYPAVLEKNLNAFCDAVSAMQLTEWKSAEIAAYGDSVAKIREQLLTYDLGCVGMSSLGPLLFAFGDEDALERVERDAAALGCEIYVSKPSNCGRAIRT
jgi:beta-ribofuranosylaminobenzene 5'-phosphate synthase